MKCLVKIITNGTEERALLVAHAESMVLIGQDRPIDIVMECLAEVTFPKESAAIWRVLDRLCKDGLSHMMVCIPRGAFVLTKIHPLLAVSSPDHRLDVVISCESGENLGKGTVSLDGGEPLSLGWGDLTSSPDRNTRVGQPLPGLFGSAHRPTTAEELRLDHTASGAVLIGYLAETLDISAGAIATPDLSRGRFALVGLAAAAGGVDFDGHGTGQRRSEEWAAAACSETYATFQRNGVLVSDRGWNRLSVHPGPRFDEALGVCDPGAVAAGRTLAACINAVPANISGHVGMAFCKRLGVDENQVRTYLLKDGEVAPTTAHGALRVEGFAERVLNAAMALRDA